VNKTEKADAPLASLGNILPGQIETLALNSQKAVCASKQVERINDSKKDTSGPDIMSDRGTEGEPRLGTSPSKSDVAAMIGESLQNVYNDILQQPVPDRFLDLLRQLETGETEPLSSSKKENS
jgi:hypothetical protein